MVCLAFALIYFAIIGVTVADDVCYKDNNNCETDFQNARYIFYDVNPPEGFNLRRDVYIRMAVLAHNLMHSEDDLLKNFKLVLPPWSHLFHWGYSEAPENIPWAKFFDLKSLQAFAPVIELHEYFSYLRTNKYVKVVIQDVYILQHFEDMFETGNFEDRWEIQKCQRPPKLRFFHYSNITSNNVKCLSYHGPATKLAQVLKTTQAKSILFEHAEVALHDMFGSKLYWEARRSMRFNTHLREIAKNFRSTYLNSSDESDNTFLDLDWRNDKPKRNALGGPYLAVHLRRKDFLRGRANEVPDLKSVAIQIAKELEKLKLTKVFIATDAPSFEYEELRDLLDKKYEILKYTAPKEVEKEYGQGGIAIVDQIICSYARYFVGTSESTFSFRIQEEREILGFPIESTFNALCKNETSCKKPSVWKIVY